MAYLHNLRRTAKVALATALIGSSNMANATDLLETPVFESVETTEVEFGTGWYIRGDLGTGPTPATTTANFQSLSGEVELGEPISLSAGVGMNLGENIRADATVNQFTNLDVSGREATFCGVEAGVAITGNCYSALGAAPTITSFMANGYFDLGEYWGFTPYIGGGLGAAYVSWRDFSVNEVCLGTVSSDCGSSGGIGENILNTQDYSTEGEFALAYNFMLGAGYRLSQNVTLDAGYRYTSIGDVKLVDSSTNTSISENFVSEGTDIHEFRIGLRYEIW